MKENPGLLKKLESLLHHKKGKRYYALKLGVAPEMVEELLKELRAKGDKDPEIEEMITKVNKEKGTIESSVICDFAPKDDIELAELHNINLDKYKISIYWSKQRPDGKFTSSVLASLKRPEDYTIEDFAKFLVDYEPKDIIVTKVGGGKYRDTVDMEISIADFHLAKKTLEGESIEEKKVQYLSIVKELVENARASFNINKIVFPISNDFFHTDNYQNQTTAGTPQDVIVEFDHEYEEGFDLLVTTINYLKAICEELEVILVQGNHDRTKAFYLAHALEVFFRRAENVTFQRDHSVIKYVNLGKTFIGYHHGNCKIDELPLVFATSRDTSADFGNASYREVHTGDKHYYMAKEIKGVRIQQMPSLSGVDRWHRDNNFINNIRAGLALIYHPVQGKIAEFESRI